MSSISIYGFPVFSNDLTIQGQLPIIIKAPKLMTFLNELDRNILDIKSLRIDGVKWFCNPNSPEPNKLGFLYMELIAKDKRTNLQVPGVVFLRGNAVAVYLRVVVENRKYVVLTRQMRAPIGTLVDEIPAGMMDASSCFTGVAMKEIYEETGLVAPSLNSLIPLGQPIIPSAGGCDEQIQLFFWETHVSSEVAEEMKKKIFGAANENETIQLVFVPVEEYEDKLLTMGDVKAICAHQFATQMGLLNDTTCIVKVKKCCGWF
jgi:ADP-sugar diphosphatase